MNVVLVRVLYAHALVLDGDLALGRLAFLARLIGHPRARGPQALLSMKDVLPDRYPIQTAGIPELIDGENRIGRLMDFGVISARVDGLYASSARELNEPQTARPDPRRQACLRLAHRTTRRLEAAADGLADVGDRVRDPPATRRSASSATA